MIYNYDFLKEQFLRKIEYIKIYLLNLILAGKNVQNTYISFTQFSNEHAH